MKKLQKIFSLLLALSMLVCLLSVGVFAEGNDTLTADLTSAQAELYAAQKALTQAQAGYDAAVAAVDKSAVTAAQAAVAAATDEEKAAANEQLTQAQAEYDAAVAAVDKSAVTAAQASVAAAQTKVAAAQKAIDDNNKQQTQPVVPQETCDFSKYKAQSSGVTVTGAFDKQLCKFVINVTIDADTSGDKVINLSDAIINAMNDYAKGYKLASYPVLPGDSNQFEINIINASGHTYQYKANSFVLTTANAHDYEQSNVLGYDGQLIPSRYIGFVSYTNPAIKKLLGTSLPTAELAFAMFDKLAALGYTDKATALGEYMKDYYKAASVADISPDKFAAAGTNGIFSVTKAQLLALEETHPELVNYLYLTNVAAGGLDSMADGDTLSVQIRWPDAQLAALSYDRFYQDFWSFGFGADNMAKMDANSDKNGGLTFCRNHGIGDYTTNQALYAETNAYLAGLAVADGLSNGKHITIDTQMCWDGPEIGNGYQNYQMAFYCAFSLAQTDTSYTVAANYYTNGSKDNSAPVVLKGAAATTVGSTETVDKPESAWASFNGNAYTLDNSKSAMSIVAVLDPAANVITLNYYRTTGGTITPVDPNPATPTPTPTNPSTDIPDPDVPATDIPDGDTPKADASKQVTGDSDMALVSGAIAVLSLCGLVYVTVSGRKKDN